MMPSKVVEIIGDLAVPLVRYSHLEPLSIARRFRISRFIAPCGTSVGHAEWLRAFARLFGGGYTPIRPSRSGNLRCSHGGTGFPGGGTLPGSQHAVHRYPLFLVKWSPQSPFRPPPANTLIYPDPGRNAPDPKGRVRKYKFALLK
jgi:hypothetical protein